MPDCNKKILLVDNEPLIRKLTRTTLAGEDLGILEAENGTQAVEIACSERPRLILLDSNLPDMNGFDVCREIRKTVKTDEVHIIFWSDYIGLKQYELDSVNCELYLLQQKLGILEIDQD